MKPVYITNAQGDSVLRYLALRSQSSWDFEADLALAKQLNHEYASLIEDSIGSGAPFALIADVWKSTWYQPITKKRLRILNNLKKAGLVSSGWVGTGHGGLSNFGVNKCKAYFITDYGRQLLAAI